MDYLKFIIEFLLYAVISYFAAWYYFEYKKKALPGRMLGSWIVAFIGAIIFSLFTGGWFNSVMNWLMNPKFGENILIRVNIITATIGAFLILYIYNIANHDRRRK